MADGTIPVFQKVHQSARELSSLPEVRYIVTVSAGICDRRTATPEVLPPSCYTPENWSLGSTSHSLHNVQHTPSLVCSPSRVSHRCLSSWDTRRGVGAEENVLWCWDEANTGVAELMLYSPGLSADPFPAKAQPGRHFNFFFFFFYESVLDQAEAQKWDDECVVIALGLLVWVSVGGLELLVGFCSQSRHQSYSSLFPWVPTWFLIKKWKKKERKSKRNPVGEGPQCLVSGLLLRLLKDGAFPRRDFNLVSPCGVHQLWGNEKFW